MWRLAGRLWSWFSGPFWAASRAHPRTTNAPLASALTVALKPPRNGLLLKWRPNVGWWRSNSRAPRRERRPARPSPLLRLLLIALCLLSSPGCSMLRPPPAAPAVVQCPIVDCLDKLTQVCEGINPPPARTCAEVYVHAVDAGSALLTCQAAQRELIDCIRKHNQELTP